MSHPARSLFAGAQHAQHQVLGVAFLLLLALFGWLTYGIFDKRFTAYDDVTLRSSHVGLQLPSRADVKIRGVIVGEVRGTQVRRDGVDLTLGLYPSRIAEIPANVSARIVPKTLFGEKYVALQVPQRPAARSIRAGDVIGESRVALEVERLLSDLYPLLRTVQPAQLNTTLTALADALEGRGEKLGRSLVVLDDYLRRMNPKLPLLVDDLRQLSTVSDTYTEVVPEVATLLRNAVTTGNTFVEKERKVQALFSDVAGFSVTGRDFLERNGENIVRLSRQGQEQLPVLAKYAPEYPCLVKGLVGLVPRQDSAFRGHTLHINLEVLPRQPRGYDPRDTPAYAERGQSAIGIDDCERSRRGAYSQRNLPPRSLVPDIRDGVDYPLGKDRPAPRIDSDLTSLLLAPLARGTEVSLR